MKSILDTVIQDGHQFIANERKVEREKCELASRMAEEEIARLRNQNAQLLKLVESEQEKTKRARDELLKTVSSMLVGFSDERDASLREAVRGITQENGAMVETIRSSMDRQSAMETASVSRGKAFNEALDVAAQESDKTLSSGFEVCAIVHFIHSLSLSLCYRALTPQTMHLKLG